MYNIDVQENHNIESNNIHKEFISASFYKFCVKNKQMKV